MRVKNGSRKKKGGSEELLKGTFNSFVKHGPVAGQSSAELSPGCEGIGQGTCWRGITDFSFCQEQVDGHEHSRYAVPETAQASKGWCDQTVSDYN